MLVKSCRICYNVFAQTALRSDRLAVINSNLERYFVIGRIVKVIIDRPLGSYHPEHKDIYYPINYGYIENIIAPDNEEQDAYVLGVNTAVKEFTGQVIAIIHRHDDIEDKWVVAPVGSAFSEKEIREQVYFQEKYFDFSIEM